jgi:hypothetical protein
MTEYNPKSVDVDWDNRSGSITFSSLKDSDEFIRRYNEYILYRVPKFIISYQEQAIKDSQVNPYNQQAYNSMMMGFNNMSLGNE